MNTATVTGYDVALKTVEPIHVAGIHGLVPNVEQLGDTFDRLFGFLEEYVERNGKAAGPHMAIYHDAGTGPIMLDMHVELVIPFDGSSVPDEHVRVYDLPGVEEMACTVHRGLFEEIDRAYKALASWALDNGYEQAGPLRDVYLNCGQGDSADYVTEVQMPVTK